MSTWRDVNFGDVLDIRGKKYSVSSKARDIGKNVYKYILIDEEGIGHDGTPDPDGPVTIIQRAEPQVSALCEASGADPMEAAAVVAQVALGAVEVGERHSDGSWSCPSPDAMDAATLAVHMLMFHAESASDHTTIDHPAGRPAHDHR